MEKSTFPRKFKALFTFLLNVALADILVMMMMMMMMTMILARGRYCFCPRVFARYHDYRNRLPLQGPLSFLIQIDDITPGCSTHKYVDDITMSEILATANSPSHMANFCTQ